MTLSRGFTISQVKTYFEYLKLMKDAEAVYRNECLVAEHLMEQVLARLPAELKDADSVGY